MTQHGMAAFSGDAAPTPSDFDPAEAWMAVVNQQMGCG
jgi:hypothetical protein